MCLNDFLLDPDLDLLLDLDSDLLLLDRDLDFPPDCFLPADFCVEEVCSSDCELPADFCVGVSTFGL